MNSIVEYWDETKHKKGDVIEDQPNPKWYLNIYSLCRCKQRFKR